jgi:hypothetical protein
MEGQNMDLMISITKQNIWKLVNQKKRVILEKIVET